jgi:hypothetical protein
MIYAILVILLADSADVPGPAPAYRCDAALTALFTPQRPAAGRYEVCVTPASLDAAILADAARVHTGPVEAVDPLDAFGAAGRYDRSALSRLFGARRARVARGWSDDVRSATSVTYVSPYPNATLTALLPGTMVIRYKLENRGL